MQGEEPLNTQSNTPTLAINNDLINHWLAISIKPFN